MVEKRCYIPNVVGSSPIGFVMFYRISSVGLEPLLHTQKVTGSSPVSGTNFHAQITQLVVCFPRKKEVDGFKSLFGLFFIQSKLIFNIYL